MDQPPTLSTPLSLAFLPDLGGLDLSCLPHSELAHFICFNLGFSLGQAPDSSFMDRRLTPIWSSPPPPWLTAQGILLSSLNNIAGHLDGFLEDGSALVLDTVCSGLFHTGSLSSPCPAAFSGRTCSLGKESSPCFPVRPSDSGSPQLRSSRIPEHLSNHPCPRHPPHSFLPVSLAITDGKAGLCVSTSRQCLESGGWFNSK